MKRRLLFWLAYLIFLALLAEAALQVLYYVTAGQLLVTRVGLPIWRPEAHAGIGVRPNLRYEHNTNEFRTTVHTNGQGFRVSERHEEYPLDKAPGSFRVLLLGPSLAFGWGVNHEDTFAARLERILGARGYGGPHRVEVINAGVPSLPPVPQLRWFKERGRRYRPDLVIQFVYGSMAVDTSADPGLAANEEGYLVRRDASTNDRIRAVLKKSGLVFYSWTIVTRLRALADDPGPGGLVEGAGRRLETPGDFDPASEAVGKSLEYYRDLRTAAEPAGTRLLLVYLPLSYCIHREDLARWRHLGVADPGRQIAFDRAFCDHLSRTGMDCLNITADLQEAAAGGERLYYWLDIHWTPEGNRVAAEAVARHLFDAAPAPR